MGVAFDSFIKAGQIGVLPSSFAEAIAPATGERNIIVQKYEEIDDALVYDSIKKTLKMFNEYREYCLAFLAKRVERRNPTSGPGLFAHIIDIGGYFRAGRTQLQVGPFSLGKIVFVPFV